MDNDPNGGQPQGLHAVMKHLQAAAEQHAKQERARAAEAAIEAQIRITAATFDKSAAYTNLILLAAYAGFFGLWQLTKEYLTASLALWSALLMLISVVTFVFFEVVKMAIVQRNFFQRAAVLRQPEVRSDPIAVFGAYEELGKVHERVQFHFLRFWHVCIVIIIATGMGGATVLGYAFVAGLAK
jgi:hypothetical protein